MRAFNRVIRGLLLSGTSLDAATLDWQVRVLAAGGTVSDATLAAVDAFVVGCKADSIWDSLLRCNLLCGNQLTAALVPLVVGAGSSTETVTNFVSGDYTEATGLAGNGTNKYFDTGLPCNDATIPQNSRHLSAYVRVSAGASKGMMGGGGTSPFFYLNTNAGFYRYSMSMAAVATSTIANTDVGFMCGSRTASNAIEFTKNGISGGTATTASAAATAESIQVFRSGASIGAWTIAAYTIGLSLSTAQALLLYTRMQTFQTAMGRNV